MKIYIGWSQVGIYRKVPLINHLNGKMEMILLPKTLLWSNILAVVFQPAWFSYMAEIYRGAC